MINAKRRNVLIVNEAFLSDCVSCGNIVDAGPYLITQNSNDNENSSSISEVIFRKKQIISEDLTIVFLDIHYIM